MRAPRHVDRQEKKKKKKTALTQPEEQDGGAAGSARPKWKKSDGRIHRVERCVAAVTGTQPRSVRCLRNWSLPLDGLPYPLRPTHSAAYFFRLLSARLHKSVRERRSAAVIYLLFLNMLLSLSLFLAGKFKPSASREKLFTPLSACCRSIFVAKLDCNRYSRLIRVCGASARMRGTWFRCFFRGEYVPIRRQGSVKRDASRNVQFSQLPRCPFSLPLSCR